MSQQGIARLQGELICFLICGTICVSRVIHTVLKAE